MAKMSILNSHVRLVLLFAVVFAFQHALGQGTASSSTQEPTVPNTSQQSESGQPVQTPRSGLKGVVSVSLGRDHYVVMKGDSAYISCTQEELAHVRLLHQKIQGDFVWLRAEGKSYIIRDPATVQRAEELLSTDAAIAQEQADIDRKRSLLDQKLEGLEKARSEVPVRVPDLINDIKRAEVDFESLKESRNVQDLEQLTELITSISAKLILVRSEVAKEQSKVAEEQSVIAEQQSSLARQQTNLQNQQADVQGKHNLYLLQLFQQAVNMIVAKPE